MKARREIRGAVAAAQKDAATDTHGQLAEQAKKLEAEAESRLQKELAAARRTAEQEAKDAYRVREEKLEREKTAIDGELAATRRQLDEARDRAEAAERRVTEAEQDAHSELERERELRFQAVEGRLGEINDMASGVSERARAKDADSPERTASEAPEEVEPAEAEEEAGSTSAGNTEPDADGRLSIATATLDELRTLGMSGVQARRIIHYREHSEGFESLDQLDRMPGFSEAHLAHLKDRLTL